MLKENFTKGKKRCQPTTTSEKMEMKCGTSKVSKRAGWEIKWNRVNAFCQDSASGDAFCNEFMDFPGELNLILKNMRISG